MSPDGEWHTYQIWTVSESSWGKNINGIRINPVHYAADIEIQSIKLVGTEAGNG